MSAGLLVVIAIVVVAVGWFLLGMYRGAVNHARAQMRQDLVKLGVISTIAKELTDVTDLPSYGFMAPFAKDRAHPFGWLWWRIEKRAHGEPQERMGWALTYRRARKAAGLPLSIRAHHTEITLALEQDRPADR